MVAAQVFFKVCKGCLKDLPASSFYRHQTNSDGLNSFCHACLYQRQKESKDNWRRRNQNDVSSYHRIWRLRKLGVNPDSVPPVPGACSIHPKPKWKFFASEMEWKCSACLMIRPPEKRVSKSASRRKSLSKKTAESLRAMSRDLKVTHGEAYSEMLLSAADRVEHEGVTKAQAVNTEKALMFEKIFGYELSKEQAKRVYLLNRILGQPITCGEWKCSKCEIKSKLTNFFDIDHIKPKHKGGSDSISNLQILCPNCHRAKTLVDVQNPK